MENLKMDKIKNLQLKSYNEYKQEIEHNFGDIISIKYVKEFYILFRVIPHIIYFMFIDEETASKLLDKYIKSYKFIFKYIANKPIYLSIINSILERDFVVAHKSIKKLFCQYPYFYLENIKNLYENEYYEIAYILITHPPKSIYKKNEDVAKYYILRYKIRKVLNRTRTNNDLITALDIYTELLKANPSDQINLIYLNNNIITYLFSGIILPPYDLLMNQYNSILDEKKILANAYNIIIEVIDKNIWSFNLSRKNLHIIELLLDAKYPEYYYAPLYLKKAFILGQLARHTEAIEFYNKVLLNFTDDIFLYALAKEQYFIGDFQNALKNINKALKTKPDNMGYLNLKCLICEKLGYYDESIKISRNIYSNNEFSFTIDTIRLLMSQNKQKDAKELFNSIDYKKLKASDLGFYNIMTLIYDKLDKFNEIFIYIVNNYYKLQNKDFSFLLYFLQLSLIAGYEGEKVNVACRSLYKQLYIAGDAKLIIITQYLPLNFLNWLHNKCYDITSLLDRIEKMDIIFEDKIDILTKIDNIKARKFLEEYKDIIDPLYYHFADIKLSMIEKKEIGFTPKTIKIINSLNKNQIEDLINTAYNEDRYDTLRKLLNCINTMKPIYYWYSFLANTILDDDKAARKALESFELDNLLIDLTQNNLAVYKEDFNYMFSNCTLFESMGNLFKKSFPYYKISLKNFILLLKKISEPNMSQIIDWNVPPILEKVKNNPDELMINSAYFKEYNDLMIKKAIIDTLLPFTELQGTKNSYASQKLLYAIYNSILTKHNEIIDIIKREERNRILANLSHSIKNLLHSVIDPLINLKNEIPEKTILINNAIKGANLIREIVNAINLSFKTTIDDLIWDVRNPGNESLSLKDIILNGLKYSISNMFDFRYFSVYSGNYYPPKLRNQFDEIKNNWESISDTEDIHCIVEFVNRYMFNCNINLSNSNQYIIGNEKSSAIKLLILFQEIIFNAVKYTSFVPRDERFINISLTELEDKIIFEVQNSYKPEIKAKTTGIGIFVIDNFAQSLNIKPIIVTDNNIYSISLEFSNIWRL